MSQKRKKADLVVARPPRPVIASLLPERKLDPVLNHLMSEVAKFGFEQFSPPPIAERDLFFGHPRLAQEFGRRAIEVKSQNGADSVLCPTHFLSLLKSDLQSQQTEGPHVAKRFYLAPVVEQGSGEEAGEHRLRHELGIFILGDEGAFANAHLLSSLTQILTRLGITKFVAEINSLGCKICQRDYQNLLQEHLRKMNSELCANCQANLENQSPSNVWGCSESECRSLLLDAPQIVDFLDEACRSSLISVLEAADELGIPYSLNPTLSDSFLEEQVLFRLTVQDRFIGFGGNYSFLSEYLGKAGRIPALGFVTWLERFWDLLPVAWQVPSRRTEVFVVALGELASRKVLKLHRELLAAGIRAAEGILGNIGIRQQLKEAQEQNSEIALIVGQKEALDDTVILRDIRSGMQEVLAFGQIIEEVKKRLDK